MKGFIVFPTYKIADSRAYIHLYGRLENGESFVAIFDRKAYFYIKADDVEKARKIADINIDKDTDVLLDGYRDFEGSPVFKLVFNTPREVPDTRKLLSDNGIKCYEADILFAYRFLIDNDIKGSVDIDGKWYTSKEYNSLNNTTFCVDRVYFLPSIKPDIEYFPKLKIMSFDIETDIKASKVFSIAICCQGYKKALINKQGIFKNAESFKNERELLIRFSELVRELDPDIITGWNCIDFDLEVLRRLYGKYALDFKIGRDDSSIAIRQSDSFYIDSTAKVEGRAVLDGISLLKTSFIQLPDYKLETASNALIGKGKLMNGDNRVSEIAECYENNPQKLIDYNIRDAELVLEIIEKKDLLNLTITRSKLTGMQLDRVKASIASLDSLYLRKLKRYKIVAPTAHTGDAEEEITGGYVRESKPGIYGNIIVLDFKSLYPSIIRTFNIDPLSYVPKGKVKDLNKKDAESLIIAPNGAHFKNEEGILPGIIQELYEERLAAKKQKDELKSYAIKILMNSFYGVLANPTCRFYNTEIANAITHFGQFLIKLTAEEMTKKGYDVIYGDSVSRDAEIITCDAKGNVQFMPICDLYRKTDIRNNEGKEYSLLNRIKVLTIDEDGKSVFKRAKYVMRHKAHKKMYRVFLTNSWFIDVTEDHSLIGYVNKLRDTKAKLLDRLREVTPKELAKKDMVKSLITLRHIPTTFEKPRNYPKELYEFMGYFIGDGSFDRMKKRNYYLHLACGIDAEETIRKLIIPLQRMGWIKNYWRKKKGDICINGLKIVNLFNSEFRHENKKVIPSFLNIESTSNVCHFLRGIFSSDGTVILRRGRPIIRFTSTNSEFIKTTRRLLFKAGISNSFFKEGAHNRYKDKMSNTISSHVVIKDAKRFRAEINFILDRKKRKLRLIARNALQKRSVANAQFDISKVVKIEEIRHSDYVYDLEVEGVHRFFANGILVHNTDSIFVDVHEKEYRKTQSTGEEIARLINRFFKDYVRRDYHRDSKMEIEFEKVYVKFFMPMVRGADKGAKKRYAGTLMVDDKEELDFVGLESVRSDWTEIAKVFQHDLLDKVFKEEKVTEYIKDFIKRLKKGEFDDKLIYRKAIRKPVSFYTKTTPPHIQAARKIGREDVGPIYYIMTTDGPEEIEHAKHKLDYEHYIDKQIKPIAESVLAFYDEKFEDLSKEHRQNCLLDYG